MKKTRFTSIMGLVLLFSLLLMPSCENELHMTLPPGPDGLSAYEVWVKEVQNGNIAWDKDRVDENNFFLYLKGADGKDGADGKSAYDLWKQEVINGLENPHHPGEKWPLENISQQDFWTYLAGANGQDGGIPVIDATSGNWFINGKDTGFSSKGEKGDNGNTPYVDDTTGNWFVNGKDTGFPSKGKDGTNGVTSAVIGSNGNWIINGVQTDYPSKGKDGTNGTNGKDGNTPYIDATTGNWFVNGVDTRIPAQGKNGTNGKDGSVISIGADGNWYIDGVNTGQPSKGNDGKAPTIDSVTGNWIINGVVTEYPSKGKDGEDGADGKSAYDLWAEQVTNGTIKDSDGSAWPTNKNSEEDFMYYMSGKKGTDGKNAYDVWKEDLKNGKIEGWEQDKNTEQDFWNYLKGKDGKDALPGKPGTSGKDVEIIKGRYNVIAQYSMQDYSEYVKPDGGVTFIVYDKDGKIAPGATVTKLPGISHAVSFVADANGVITVPKESLPTDGDVDARFGSSTVITAGGESEISAPNTYVPCRMQLRLIESTLTKPEMVLGSVRFNLRVERKIDNLSEWELVPTYLPLVGGQVSVYQSSKKDDFLSNILVKKYTFTSGEGAVSISRPIYSKYPYGSGGLSTWNDTYYFFQFTTYYGESPRANIVLKVPPIQYLPPLKITADAGARNGTLLSSLTLSFDTDNLGINKDILVENDFTKESSGGYIYYYAKKVAFSDVITAKNISLSFKAGGNISENTNSLLGGLNRIENVFDGSVLSVTTTSNNFLGYPMNVGTVEIQSATSASIESSIFGMFDTIHINVGAY